MRLKVSGSGGIYTCRPRAYDTENHIQLLDTLSLTEISLLSKFSKGYISQVKHGKCPPSKKLLEVLKNHHRRIQTEHDYLTLFLRSRKAMEVSPGTEQFYRIKLGRFLSEVNADKAIIAMFIESGLRLSELVNIKLEVVKRLLAESYTRWEELEQLKK